MVDFDLSPSLRQQRYQLVLRRKSAGTAPGKSQHLDVAANVERGHVNVTLWVALAIGGLAFAVLAIAVVDRGIPSAYRRWLESRATRAYEREARAEMESQKRRSAGALAHATKGEKIIFEYLVVQGPLGPDSYALTQNALYYGERWTRVPLTDITGVSTVDDNLGEGLHIHYAEFRVTDVNVPNHRIRAASHSAARDCVARVKMMTSPSGRSGDSSTGSS